MSLLYIYTLLRAFTMNLRPALKPAPNLTGAVRKPVSSSSGFLIPRRSTTYTPVETVMAKTQNDDNGLYNTFFRLFYFTWLRVSLGPYIFVLLPLPWWGDDSPRSVVWIVS